MQSAKQGSIKYYFCMERMLDDIIVEQVEKI